MSLPTPTGNPYPYEPGHPLHDLPANRVWIAWLYAHGARPFPTPVELADNGLFSSFLMQLHVGAKPHEFCQACAPVEKNR